MGGGQPKNTTSTTETVIPDWLKQNYQSFITQTNAANAKPYQAYGGQLNAGPSDGQNIVGNISAAGANYGLPGQQAQLNGLSNVINGQYNTTAAANPYAGQTTSLGVNPYQGQMTNVGTNAYAGQNQYLDKMVNNSNQNITDAYNRNAVPALAAQFAHGGAFGGSAMEQAGQQSQDTLAKNLAQSTNGLRFNDYTAQQGLAENALNRNVQAQQVDLSRNSGLAQQGIQNSINTQQTDLARNSALSQQGFENQLSANQQNAGQVINGSQGLNAAGQLQMGYLNGLNQYGQVQQDYAQGNINQAYNDWYQQNYGYDQQKLNNYGNALNSIAGNFTGSSATGANPAYKARTAGGALASAAGGAAAGASFGPWGAVAGGVIGAGSYYL